MYKNILNWGSVNIVNNEHTWAEGIKGGKVLDIIKTDKNPLCLIAGPGTGKTFALMRRTARLLQEESVDPNKILVVTFTRATAHDLVDELSKLDVDGTNDIKAITLHSFCFSTLMRRGVLEITGRNPRTLLDFEKRFLLEDLKTLGLGSIRQLKKDIKAFEAAWARLQHEESGWPVDQKDKLVSQSLVDWLMYHNAMLLEELIPLTLTYLKNNPACHERRMFQHIFVDEYQDLNKAEQSLIDLLALKASIMIIGDEDQSIYESFRYAHPEGIINYANEHPKNHFLMDECRRCPKKVVDLANNLISNNKIRKEKILDPLNDNPEGDVKVVQWETMEEETVGISKFIYGKIEEGVDPGKVLVLCPNRKLGYEIRDQLKQLNVNAFSFFNEELLDGRPTDKKSIEEYTFTILTLLAHPEDMVALRCFLGFGSSTLLSKPYKRLIDYCNQNQLTPKKALENMIIEDEAIPYTKGLLDRYKLLKEIVEEYNGLTGFDLLDRLYPQEEEWTEPFRTLLFDITNDATPLDIHDLLKNSVTQPEMPSDVDYVRVMSLYKSKGLTADLVVICGCIDGLIPYRENDISGKELERFIEEQRRLFYVGITRTKNILVISSFLKLPAPLSYSMGIKRGRIIRGQAETIASPFIQELGPKLPEALFGNELIDDDT